MVAFDNICHTLSAKARSRNISKSMTNAKAFFPDFEIIGVLCYCRQGYASQMSDELSRYFAQSAISGYPKFTKSAGFACFYLHQSQSLKTISKQVQFSELMFARQLVFLVAHPVHLSGDDRVSEVVSVLPESEQALQTCVVEVPDTEEGKHLSKFSRKFAVPLRQAMRDKGVLYRRKFNKPIAGLCWHIFLSQNDKALLGVSLPHNRSDHEQGIYRLKMPQDAPSRSTLKLEEAIYTFIPKTDQADLFREGYRAVDLGACPGGWTYQLVKRGVQVAAIDNGKMQAQLMATGLVEYHAVDGFKYRPLHGPVQWLVCDMIEQPQRVTNLMLDWLLDGDARHAIFNLKLPMQNRYATMTECLNLLREGLKGAGISFSLQAKHLYHNRDEVTVCILRDGDL